MCIIGGVDNEGNEAMTNELPACLACYFTIVNGDTETPLLSLEGVDAWEAIRNHVLTRSYEQLKAEIADLRIDVIDDPERYAVIVYL
jgi:hypothetical protein